MEWSTGAGSDTPGRHSPRFCPSPALTFLVLQPPALQVVAIAALELPLAVVGDRDGHKGVQGIEALLGREVSRGQWRWLARELKQSSVTESWDGQSWKRPTRIIQILALDCPSNPILCLGVVSKCSWSSGNLGDVTIACSCAQPPSGWWFHLE